MPRERVGAEVWRGRDRERARWGQRERAGRAGWGGIGGWSRGRDGGAGNVAGGVEIVLSKCVLINGVVLVLRRLYC